MIEVKPPIIAIKKGDAEILQFMCEGHTSHDIAIKMGMSLQAVRHRIDRYMDQTKAKNRIHMVVLLIKHKIIVL